MTGQASWYVLIVHTQSIQSKRCTSKNVDGTRYRVLWHHFNYECTDQFIHQFNCSYTHSFLMLHGTFHIWNPLRKRLISIWLHPRFLHMTPRWPTPSIPKSFHPSARFWSKVTSQDSVFFFRGRILMEEIWRMEIWDPKPLWKPQSFPHGENQKKWAAWRYVFWERILWKVPF